MFSAELGSHGAFLKNVEVNNNAISTSRKIFKALSSGCNLSGLQIKFSRRSQYSTEDMFRMLEPLLTRPGTGGCEYEAGSGEACCCYCTTEALRTLKAIELSAWVEDLKDRKKQYPPGVLPGYGNQLLLRRASDEMLPSC